ncbi:hypothetical protein [Vibrio mangrovi]|uniref:Outer membrane protein beta-barrel domain-containing protein n=1 Tax=Vibrio mangrovi TaxID=474394 RepID=A0A1Y6ISQ4_9VIBR|nr:hypothetical protein [Vibrio mangrovi]MDW6001322.1 hypothetical protein [Vibrio mangrovi]SMS00656.1 hypothetical protein VIM7927_01925 [Vibrio mangrovi]
MKTVIVAIGALTLSSIAYAESSVTSPQVAVGIGVDQGLSAILELNDQYRLSAGNDGMSADYLFKKGQFEQQNIPVDWYVGAGGWAEWDDGDDFGLRLPLGVDWVYKSRIHVYGQVHPELNLHDDVELQLGAAAGVTYKF